MGEFKVETSILQPSRVSFERFSGLRGNPLYPYGSVLRLTRIEAPKDQIYARVLRAVCDTQRWSAQILLGSLQNSGDPNSALDTEGVVYGFKLTYRGTPNPKTVRGLRNAIQKQSQFPYTYNQEENKEITGKEGGLYLEDQERVRRCFNEDVALVFGPKARVVDFHGVGDCLYRAFVAATVPELVKQLTRNPRKKNQAYEKTVTHLGDVLRRTLTRSISVKQAALQLYNSIIPDGAGGLGDQLFAYKENPSLLWPTSAFAGKKLRGFPLEKDVRDVYAFPHHYTRDDLRGFIDSNYDRCEFSQGNMELTLLPLLTHYKVVHMEMRQGPLYASSSGTQDPPTQAEKDRVKAILNQEIQARREGSSGRKLLELYLKHLSQPVTQVYLIMTYNRNHWIYVDTEGALAGDAG